MRNGFGVRGSGFFSPRNNFFLRDDVEIELLYEPRALSARFADMSATASRAGWMELSSSEECRVTGRRGDRSGQMAARQAFSVTGAVGRQELDPSLLATTPGTSVPALRAMRMPDDVRAYRRAREIRVVVARPFWGKIR